MSDLDRKSREGYMAPTEQSMDDLPTLRERTNWGVRCGLLAIAAGLAAVFYIATLVRPYEADGSPLKLGSHRSIGLPPCRFAQMTDMPCPSCGMTTSFALLVRGDVWNSMKANWVGTGLAVFCALLIPWAIASALLGRMFLVRRIDWVLGLLIGVFTILMLGRWGVILLMSVFE